MAKKVKTAVKAFAPVVIQDMKALNTAITGALTSYNNAGNKGWSIILSCAWHVVNSDNQITPLVRFLNGIKVRKIREAYIAYACAHCGIKKTKTGFKFDSSQTVSLDVIRQENPLDWKAPTVSKPVDEIEVLKAAIKKLKGGFDDDGKAVEGAKVHAVTITAMEELLKRIERANDSPLVAVAA